MLVQKVTKDTLRGREPDGLAQRTGKSIGAAPPKNPPLRGTLCTLARLVPFRRVGSGRIPPICAAAHIQSLNMTRPTVCAWKGSIKQEFVRI